MPVHTYKIGNFFRKAEEILPVEFPLAVPASPLQASEFFWQFLKKRGRTKYVHAFGFFFFS